MSIAGFWPTFLVGCFGGIMGEVLHWYALRQSPRIAAYRKGMRYWLTTVAMILVGGVLATLYGVESKSAILVAQIGLTAPLLIKALAQTVPESNERNLSEMPSILDFLRGS